MAITGDSPIYAKNVETELRLRLQALIQDADVDLLLWIASRLIELQNADEE